MEVLWTKPAIDLAPSADPPARYPHTSAGYGNTPWAMTLPGSAAETWLIKAGPIPFPMFPGEDVPLAKMMTTSSHLPLMRSLRVSPACRLNRLVADAEGDVRGIGSPVFSSTVNPPLRNMFPSALAMAESTGALRMTWVEGGAALTSGDGAAIARAFRSPAKKRVLETFMMDSSELIVS